MLYIEYKLGHSNLWHRAEEQDQVVSASCYFLRRSRLHEPENIPRLIVALIVRVFTVQIAQPACKMPSSDPASRVFALNTELCAEHERIPVRAWRVAHYHAAEMRCQSNSGRFSKRICSTATARNIAAEMSSCLSREKTSFPLFNVAKLAGSCGQLIRRKGRPSGPRGTASFRNPFCVFIRVSPRNRTRNELFSARFVASAGAKRLGLHPHERARASSRRAQADDETFLFASQNFSGEKAKASFAF